MRIFKSFHMLSLLLSLLFLLSCKTDSKSDQTPKTSIPAFNLTYMDTTTRPQDDFYRYVNGSWLDNTEIPANRSSVAIGSKLGEQINEDLLAILKTAGSDESLEYGSAQAKAVRLFDSYMDSVGRDEAGVSRMRSLLEQVDKIESVADLDAYMVEMTPLDLGNLFQIAVSADQKDSNKNVLHIERPDLGLPAESFYLEENERADAIREKYMAFLKQMFEMTEVAEGEEAEKQARLVLIFETNLAKNTLNKTERRKPKNYYNPMTISQLAEQMSGFNWVGYFNALGVAASDTIIVTQPAYLEYLESVFSEGDLDDLKMFLKASIILDLGNRSGMEMYKTGWEFYAKELSGQSKNSPMDQRALFVVKSFLGEAMGRLYVEKRFSQKVKRDVEEMIQGIIQAYRMRISGIEWMDQTTKEKALEKLDKMTFQVGYPQQWEDYKGLEIKAPNEGGVYVNNYLNIKEWEFKKALEKLNKPVDKSKWWYPPHAIAGWYPWQFNEFVITAAMLQPPFFDNNVDAAVNYGAIGAIIAHEISHGFDSEGAKYDPDGNLKNWWSTKDLEAFKRKGDSLTVQYNTIEVLPGVYVDGGLTLAENIADFGGVNVAYDALRLHLEKHGDPGLIDGYTQEQRFFLAHVGKMRMKFRNKALRQFIKKNTHTPFMFRAVQPLKNMDAFYEAFNIQEGDGMYLAPEERVKIW